MTTVDILHKQGKSQKVVAVHTVLCQSPLKKTWLEAKCGEVQMQEEWPQPEKIIKTSLLKNSWDLHKEWI